MGSLGIAIDGGRYVRIDSSPGDFPRTVKLRTLSSSQGKAKLDFCIFRKNGPIVRKSLLVEGLSGIGNSPAELKLSVQRTSYALWLIDVRIPDGSREQIRVRTGIGLWPLIVLTALLVVFAAWLLIPLTGGFGFSSGNKPPEVVLTAELTTDSAEKVEAAEIPRVEEAAATVIAVPDVTDESRTAALSALPVLPDLTTVYFQPESSALSRTARVELENLAKLIPENISLEIGGHCANYGTEKGRMALSLNRARVVTLFLSERIPESVQLQIRSYGSFRPISDNPESQDMNRRVEILSDGSAE
ncbi:MAG: hypothetical protein DRP70_13225 [Spirochaetes bacterium]|nr:MAG: hypothetical protein DRP60_04610 [Spirochaetota bacterium]RKX84449.1 MAG: hypothetical protein DRP70_13225 [Spirochaetota bacterium]RKX95395.1 MAG: hypothetical protein DRZ90_10365 [Spirochaetota bacterium]